MNVQQRQGSQNRVEIGAVTITHVAAVIRKFHGLWSQAIRISEGPLYRISEGHKDFMTILEGVKFLLLLEWRFQTNLDHYRLVPVALNQSSLMGISVKQ